MELTTRIEIQPSADKIRHEDTVMTLGSCFADEIAGEMLRDKFNVHSNPFGTLYNPASICAHLLRCLSERPYQAGDPEIFEADGLWHSWMHHTSFSSPDRDALLDRLNATLRLTASHLRTARWLIVTFGTAYVYRLRHSGMLVANCHKQPDSLFVRERMSAYDIADMWRQALQLLHAVNPGLHVVCTVSPIRHQRDGLHPNNLSKAELLLAVDALRDATYFPSYEIMLDELRDYRFYDDDMLHPSHRAVEYIYERFGQTFMTPETLALAAQCRDVVRAAGHRPFRPESEQYRQFQRNTLAKIQKLKQQYPFLDFTEETKQCSTEFQK
ncbi:MAG: GSCFA domain-containing protein [Bacteroidaceae bacterium]|nr:GSCFA domain-containing protein [Bacteroidaceae bacterium]